MDPLIITVAAVGAELTRAQQPRLPITPDELAEDAAQCEAAGAAVYHLHVRTPAGEPTMDLDTFRAAREAIASRTDLIMQFTTGGAIGDDEDARIAPLNLRPEMATLTTGSVNFGDAVFVNPLPLVVRLYSTMRSLGILPEFEIFEAGMIATAERIYQEHGDGHHRHFDFVLGVPGALPAWPGLLEFLAARLAGGATWSATGVGRDHLPIARETIALGGHVRTGFEDVLYYERGRLAESNAELVRRVAGLAESAGREIAGAAGARRLFGL